jgi:DedD protein
LVAAIGSYFLLLFLPLFLPLLVSRMAWFSWMGKNKQDTQEPEGAYVARAEDPAVAAGRSRSKRAGKGAHEAVDPVLPEKKRARRRLVGAIALALAVIIGLPMVLDSEPKPLSGDIAIQIPSKDKPYSAGGSKVAAEQSLDPNETLVDMDKPGKPSASASTSANPSASTSANPSASTSGTALTKPSANASASVSANASANHLAAGTAPITQAGEPSRAITPVKPETNPVGKPETRPEAKPEHKPETKPVNKPESKPEAKPELKPENKPIKPENKPELKPETKPENKPIVKPTPEPRPVVKPTPEPRLAIKPEADAENGDAGRAQAILEGKPEPKPKKYVLQVAALATQEKIDELQGKLSNAGIASHTQKVAVEGGTRTRIRVGPFANKEEALKMREKLVKLGLNGTLMPQ